MWQITLSDLFDVLVDDTNVIVFDLGTMERIYEGKSQFYHDYKDYKIESVEQYIEAICINIDSTKEDD